jgi:hypothetical protein
VPGTGSTAKLAALSAVYSKLFTAITTDKIVIGFSVYFRWVTVPPCKAAFITAEPSWFALYLLNESFSTMLAIQQRKLLTIYFLDTG